MYRHLFIQLLFRGEVFIHMDRRFLLVVAVFSAVLFSAAKPKNAAPVGPAKGVKTPGVQIPFANLKAEATIPAAGKPAWIFFAAGGPGSIYFPGPDKLEKIDARTNKPGEPVTGLKKPCGGMVSAFGSLWVPTCGDGALQRLDSKTLKVTATIPAGTGDALGNIAASTDSVWLLTDNKETLSRVDPEQNTVTGEFRLPVGCRNLTFAENALWIACPALNKILKINPATNIVDKRIEVSANPVAIAAGQGSIWVLAAKDGKIDRIDPKTDKVTKTIDLLAPAGEGGIAFGDGYLWVTMAGFPLTRIDVTAETVAQQFWGDGGGAIRTSAGALWLSNLNNGTISRIDPKLVLATLAE
jgi:virginiamycin B lyase